MCRTFSKYCTTTRSKIVQHCHISLASLVAGLHLSFTVIMGLSAAYWCFKRDASIVEVFKKAKGPSLGTARIQMGVLWKSSSEHLSVMVIDRMFHDTAMMLILLYHGDRCSRGRWQDVWRGLGWPSDWVSRHPQGEEGVIIMLYTASDWVLFNLLS